MGVSTIDQCTGQALRFATATRALGAQRRSASDLTECKIALKKKIIGPFWKNGVSILAPNDIRIRDLAEIANKPWELSERSTLQRPLFNLISAPTYTCGFHRTRFLVLITCESRSRHIIPCEEGHHKTGEKTTSMGVRRQKLFPNIDILRKYIMMVHIDWCSKMKTWERIPKP